MTIARILAQKGRDVATAAPQETLRGIVDILAAKHIGSIIIADAGGAMVGIVSERDVVRAIARRGCDALDDPVSAYMTKEVVTAREDDDVIAVVQKMSTGRFRHMPVLAEGRIVGIVSTGDAVKYRLEQLQRDQDALKEYIATA